MKKISDNNEIYENIIVPILGNVTDVYQAVSVVDVISQKATSINASRYQPFFFYVQRTSLHYAILCLCKLYDKNGKKTQFTIFSLLNSIEKEIPDDTFPVLEKKLLEDLELPKKVISELSGGSVSAPVRKRKFLSSLRHADWISEGKNKTLKICFSFRHKKIAHHENLRLSEKVLPDYYPSTEQIKWCADRVHDVCCLALDIHGVSRPHMPSCFKGIKGNTLSVIRKVLD